MSFYTLYEFGFDSHWCQFIFPSDFSVMHTQHARKYCVEWFLTELWIFVVLWMALCKCKLPSVPLLTNSHHTAIYVLVFSKRCIWWCSNVWLTPLRFDRRCEWTYPADPPIPKGYYAPAYITMNRFWGCVGCWKRKCAPSNFILTLIEIWISYILLILTNSRRHLRNRMQWISCRQ